jgi:uncharacterized protein
MMWVLFAGVLGLGFFAPKLIFSGNAVMAQGAYWTYAVLWGLLISPMVYAFLTIDPSLIFRALVITTATFGAMSLVGYTTKRDLSGLSGFFMMATIGLLIAILVNVIFFGSELMSLVTSGLVVLVFSGSPPTRPSRSRRCTSRAMPPAWCRARRSSAPSCSTAASSSCSSIS